MYGRFNLRLTPAELSEFFRVLDTPDTGIRYNIAPTQPLAFIRQTDDRREWATGPWGFHPVWAKSESHVIINARSETVLTNRTFSKSARKRRCIVPASGFYEWQTVGKAKQPYHITLKTGERVLTVTVNGTDSSEDIAGQVETAMSQMIGDG